MSPLLKSPKTPQNKALTENPKTNSANNFAGYYDFSIKSARLYLVIERWLELSVELQEPIVKILQ